MGRPEVADLFHIFVLPLFAFELELLNRCGHVVAVRCHAVIGDPKIASPEVAKVMCVVPVDGDVFFLVDIATD